MSASNFDNCYIHPYHYPYPYYGMYPYYGHYQPPMYGWVCPKCKKSNSPSVHACSCNYQDKEELK